MAEGILVGFLIMIAVVFTGFWLLGLKSDHMDGPPVSHLSGLIALVAVIAALVFTFT